jgi:hypothetical protein
MRRTAAVDTSTLDPQTARSLEFVKKLVRGMQMEAEVNLAPDDGEGLRGRDPARDRRARRGPHHRQARRGARGDPVSDEPHRPPAGRAPKHVAVDAEGYRARHEDQLGEMARRLGERVAAEGKSSRSTR